MPQVDDRHRGGNVEAVLGAPSETVVWNEAEYFPFDDGNPYVGREAVLNGVFALLGSDWEYWTLTPAALGVTARIVRRDWMAQRGLDSVPWYGC
jgi:hypothetical protein